MAIKRKQSDAVAELLAAAPSRVIADLPVRLAATRPDVRRECFEYLKTHVYLSGNLKQQSEDEILLALRCDLDPDLSELDE